MCGACGTGRVAAPWEDVLAGAGPAERAARAAAARRLLSAQRMRVTPWRGGYLLATPTGAARPVASLGELWAAAGPVPPPPAGQHGWARAAAPVGWDLQAAAVWISAAARSGTLAAAELPGGAVGFAADGTASVEHRSGTKVGILGPDPGTALADLLGFAARG